MTTSSVAVATFNGEKHLADQLKSIIDQTQKVNEIIISDDCSSDKTIDIVKNLISETSFNIKLLRNPNRLGVMKNFENAIKHCTGEIIFLADQDDVWKRTKVQKVISYFEENTETNLIIHDGVLTNQNLEHKELTKFMQIKSAYGKINTVYTGCLMAFRRNILPIALPFPENLEILHDYWINLVAESIGSKEILHESLQYIRRHSQNTSEWVINNPFKKTTKKDMFLSNIRISATKNYDLNIKINRILVQRIKEKLEDPAFIDLLKNCHGSILLLENKVIANEQRNAIISSGFIIKFFLAFRFYLNGGYMEFNNFWSFLKDVFR